MKEIKVRLVDKHEKSNKISMSYATFQELEGEDSWQGSTPWIRLSEDLFAGLYDHHAKDREVYEGDIYEWCELILPIKFEKSLHGYRFMWGNGELLAAYIYHGKYRGNIYENPELLEIKK